MMRRFLAILFALTLFSSLPLKAEDLSYDRYAAIFPDGNTRNTAEKTAAHFLVYPLEWVRWPVDKFLVWIENNAIDKKMQWLYDQLVARGITPEGSIVSIGSLGGGATVDIVRLLRQKVHYPDLVARGRMEWTEGVNFDVGSDLGWERIGGTGFYATGHFQYSNRPEEHFYGIGPDASAGDGTSFRMETTALGLAVGHQWGPVLSAGVDFTYENVNITNGEDGGRGRIDTIFPSGSIPGLEGDEFVRIGLQLRHDSRNSSENSTRGGEERLGFHYYEGLADSEAQFFKYEVEITRFFSLGSNRRVLAFRFYGEHNDETEDHTVPFHQMAKLGGYGAYPRLSRTLRGFDFNRFFDKSALLFNLEYRYTVWEYKDWKLDSVLFWDEGQVFGEFSEFQFRDFRESYGIGGRLSVANVVLFAIELAHGDEGTNLYVKSEAPF